MTKLYIWKNNYLKQNIIHFKSKNNKCLLLNYQKGKFNDFEIIDVLEIGLDNGEHDAISVNHFYDDNYQTIKFIFDIDSLDFS